MTRPAVFLAALALTGAGLAQAATTPTHKQLETIVRTWSKRLNANDNVGAAHLFKIPATVIQYPYEYRFKTTKQLAAWHSALPCSGQVIAIRYNKNTATATFRLGNRGLRLCDGPGQLAAARFTVVNGLITKWEQVQVPTGRTT
jgi:hypothetical protein